MTTRRRILVGVDGSDDSLKAVKYAVREALADGSDLWLVYATDPVVIVNGYVWAVAATDDDLHRAGQAVLERVKALVAADGLPAERMVAEVVTGAPGEVLIRLSEQAALLVMGRRSIGGLERMFVGSTSVQVAGRAACPVIVVSHSGQHEPGDAHGVVAVAIGAWPPHTAALQWAASEAARRHCSMQVVHVVPTEGVVPTSAFKATAAAIEAHLQPLREQYPDTSIEVAVRTGVPIDELVAASRTADLLVLGVHPARLSGLARGLLAHAHCPVGVSS